MTWKKRRNIITESSGLVAQLGAHHIRIVGVEGSNPFKSTKQKCHPAGVALLFGMALAQVGFENSNPTCREQVGGEGSTEPNHDETNPFKSGRERSPRRGGISVWYGTGAEGIRKFKSNLPALDLYSFFRVTAL